MKIQKDAASAPVRYKDFYFRLFAALLAGHLIVVFGVDDKLPELLLSWDYYRSLAFSFVIAFILINIVYLVTIRLDIFYDWRRLPVQRASLQLLLALVIPAVIAFLLAAWYFSLYGIRILDTPYLKFDFPVIVLMLVLLNAYYIAFYFYRQWQGVQVAPPNGVQVPSEPQPGAYKQVFVVHKGAQSIPLTVIDVCYFYREGEYNYVRTFHEERFLITESLDELQQQLDEQLFFRANRQLLVNRKACGHFQPLLYGKLELFIIPPLKDKVIISQKRSKSFKEWLEK